MSLDSEALDIIFHKAHTAHSFESTPVPKETLEAIYNSAKFGPTTFNCQPLRIIYVQSPTEKQKLISNLMEGNHKQTNEAPVTAILAYDTKFYEHLDKLCPAYDAKSLYIANESWQIPTASLNANLQAGYFIVAARAHGLDVGPMSGVNFAGVDETFFKDTTYKSFLVVNLGKASSTAYYPRAPRFEVEEAVKFI